MRSLVGGGTDVNIKNSDGETALDMLDDCDESEAIRIIITEATSS